MSRGAKILIGVLTLDVLLAIAVLFEWGLRCDFEKNDGKEASLQTVRSVEAVFAKDAKNAWYYDSGDGEILGTVKLIEELDEETLYVCLGTLKYAGTVNEDDTLQKFRGKYSIICDGYDPVIGGNHRTEKNTIIWIE